MQIEDVNKDEYKKDEDELVDELCRIALYFRCGHIDYAEMRKNMKIILGFD